jgi:hypothetical protein
MNSSFVALLAIAIVAVYLFIFYDRRLVEMHAFDANAAWNCRGLHLGWWAAGAHDLELHCAES